MNKFRKMIATVDTIVRQLDPEVIVQRTFYDEASGRLFVSLVKGRREHELMLKGGDFNNGDLERVKQSIQTGINRVRHQPPS